MLPMRCLRDSERARHTFPASQGSQGSQLAALRWPGVTVTSHRKEISPVAFCSESGSRKTTSFGSVVACAATQE
jgi:hypothetical protein